MGIDASVPEFLRKKKVEGDGEGEWSMLCLIPTLLWLTRQAPERPFHSQNDKLPRKLKGKENPAMTCLRLANEFKNYT